MEIKTIRVIISLYLKLMGTVLFFTILIFQNNYAQRQTEIKPKNTIIDFDKSYINQRNNFLGKATKSGNNVTLIGRWDNGIVNAVAVKGNIAYIPNRGYLEIVDITDPSNPVELKNALIPGEKYISDIAVNGNYAYLVDWVDGLRIIDISNPSAPTEVGFFNTGSSARGAFANARGVYVRGNYAYVANEMAGLRIVDISNPAVPTEIGFFDTKATALNVYVRGNYAYVADGYDGLRIIDISNPTAPKEVGFFDTNGSPRDVYVSGNYAYVADYLNGLRIIDISNLATPTEIGFFDTADKAFGVYVSGSYAYVADNNDGLRIIDISNPTAPKEVGFFDINGETWGVYVNGNYAYVAARSTGLRIIDVHNPAVPFEVGFFEVERYAKGVYVNGNYAYVANWFYGGLRILDISNPAVPTEVGFFDTGSFTNCVFVRGNYAYVAARRDGLRILDISNPTAPKEIGFIDLNAEFWGVYVDGNYAYVAAGIYGLSIIDVSNPAAPTETGFINTAGYAYAVYISGSYAYLASWSHGLRIIDVSNPAVPVETGYFDTGSKAKGVCISGNYAYIADYNDGLRIIDVSNPAMPSEVGFYDTGGQAEGVYVVDKYAYIADGSDLLRIIDISNPVSPSEVGFFNTGPTAQGVYVSGNYVYVAAYDGGLYILQDDLINIIPPTYLGSNATNIKKVMITWEDNSNNENGYKLERTDAEGSVFNLLKDLPANTSSFIDTTVEEGKHYKYRVKAYSQSLESSYSNESTVLTPISTIAPPSNVAIKPDTSGNFEISWTDNSNNEDGFIIQRGTVDSGSTTSIVQGLFKTSSVMDLIPTFVPIDTVPPNSAKYTDTKTTEGASYIYQVAAYNSNGVSVPKMDTTKTTFTALVAPSNLTATILGTTLMKVKLDWVNKSKIYSDVIIERGDNDSTNYIFVDSVTSGISSYIDSLLNTGHIYYYRARAYNSNSSSVYVYTSSGIITDVESFDNLMPKEYILYQNYPNPFNPSTSIRFSLPVESKVQIKIFNVLGQVVKELLNSSKAAGNYKLIFNANNLASGIYFYRIIAKSVEGKKDFIETKKLILMK